MKTAKSMTKAAPAKPATKSGKPDVKPTAPLKKVVTKPDAAKAAAAKPIAQSAVKAPTAAKPAKAPAAPKAAASTKPAAKTAPAAPAKTAVKKVSTVADTVEISIEDISLRAYFIAERRHKMGWPGDPSSDWIEAERQLRQEAANAAKLSK